MKTARREAAGQGRRYPAQLNGTPLESREQLQELLKEMAPGDEVALDMERGGKRETLTFELGER